MGVQGSWGYFWRYLLLIMVGVADILIQQINYLLNKHYDGLMKIWQKQKSSN
jgi:hypothetical protein